MTQPLTAWTLENLQSAQKQIPVFAELQAWRSKQLQEFMRLGFPKRRDEQWKYTSLSCLTEKKFTVQSSFRKSALDYSAYYLPDSYRLVFINGEFSPDHSHWQDLPKEITLSRIHNLENSQIDLYHEMSRLPAENALSNFHWLNGALMGDGLFLVMPDKIELTKPLHLLYLSTENNEPLMQHPRHIIHLGQHSRLTLVEEYAGFGDQCYFNNVVSKISLGQGAHLDYYKLQRESAGGIHIANSFIEQGADSRLRAFHTALGGKLNREDFNVLLKGSRAECELSGFYYPKSGQHIDFHTRIDHFDSQTISRQYYKGMIADDGHAVFNGKIIAHPLTKQVQAEQKNYNLLLSDSAGVDTKPELEVYSDEIQCSHGATVGNLDEDAIFYMRSRGISEELARNLLMSGFAQEVLNRIPHVQIAAKLKRATYA